MSFEDPWDYGRMQRRRSREPAYQCFICGREGRASSMTTVRADNPILYGPYVTVHKGMCHDRYLRRHG